MWEWWVWLCPVSSSNFKKKKSLADPSNPPKIIFPIQIPHDQIEEIPRFSTSILPFASIKMIQASLISRVNTSFQVNAYVKYLCLALFSPLLLPLFFAFFPFLCALEIFFRLCRRSWRRKIRRRKTAAMAGAKEGCGVGVGMMIGHEEIGNGQRLLQRYLEDQLALVVESLYDQCGGEDEEITGANEEYFDSNGPSLIPGEN